MVIYMKILVDEMPINKEKCPFSILQIMPLGFDVKNYSKLEAKYYECNITKDFCNLECGLCNGLKPAIEDLNGGTYV